MSNTAPENDYDILIQRSLIFAVLGQPDRESDLGWAKRWGWGTPRQGFWARFTIAYISGDNVWQICAPIPGKTISFERLYRKLRNPMFRFRHHLWRYKARELRAGVNAP